MSSTQAVSLSRSYHALGERKARDLRGFTLANIVQGNLRTMFRKGYRLVKFITFASHYLGAFAYLFSHPVNSLALMHCQIGIATTSSPSRERRILTDADSLDLSNAAKASCRNSEITASQRGSQFLCFLSPIEGSSGRLDQDPIEFFFCRIGRARLKMDLGQRQPQPQIGRL